MYVKLCLIVAQYYYRRIDVMSSNKKLVIIIAALCIAVVGVITGLILVLVASNQSANTQVKMKYEATDVFVKMEANLRDNNTTYPFKNGDSTYLELNAEIMEGNLSQPNSDTTLAVSDSRIVFEYIFTNLSHSINAYIDHTNELTITDNFTLSYAYSDEPVVDYDAMTLQDGTALTLEDSYTRQILMSDAYTYNVKYVYIVADVNNILADANIAGNFNWSLTRKDITTVTITYNAMANDSGLQADAAYITSTLPAATAIEAPKIYPVRDTEVFVGWGVGENATETITFPYKAAESVALYPVYKACNIPENIVYDKVADCYYVKNVPVADPTITEVVIPDYYDNGTNGKKPISYISDAESSGNNLLSDCKNTATVYIGKNIHTLGSYALSGFCVTNVIIAEGSQLTTIGSSVFASTAIQHISLPDSVEVINSYAFNYCTNLQSIDLGTGLTTIGGNVFDGCTSLESIYIPASVNSINSSAFVGCSNIESLFVDENNAKYTSKNHLTGEECNGIFTYSSDGYYSLVAACSGTILYEGLQKIANYACSGYEPEDPKLVLPESMVYISSWAFYNAKITSLTIPAKTRIIGTSITQGCDDLEEIIISSSNKYYSTNSYYYEGETKVEVPCNAVINQKTNQENWLIAACKNTVVGAGVVYIHNEAFTGLPITELDLDNGSLVTISDSCFSSTTLVSLTIPSTVTSIGYGITNYCTNMSSITVDSANTIYYCPEGSNSIVTIADNILIAGCPQSNIVEGITRVEKNAFRGKITPQDLVLPVSLKTIGEYAFYDNSYTRSITFAPNSELEEIEKYGFCINLNTSLISLTLPASLKRIGRNAFGGMNYLTELVFENTAGWKQYSDVEYSKFVKDVDLSDPAANARNFKSGVGWTTMYYSCE